MVISMEKQAGGMGCRLDEGMGEGMDEEMG